MSNRLRSPGRGWIVPTALVALCAAAVWYWAARPNLSPRNFDVVEPGVLYRSAALTPAALHRVADEHHIKTIVDLGGFDKDPTGERIAARTAEALGLERRVFPLEGDGTGNPNAYVAALRVITDPSKQPVLVHCSSGAQRTGGCVMLYRDLVQGRPMDSTYSEATAHGHDSARNPKLMPYLRKWHEKIAEAFRSGTYIAGQPPPEAAAPPVSAAAPADTRGNRE